MANEINRRDFLKLTAIGGIGVVFASALPSMRAQRGKTILFRAVVGHALGLPVRPIRTLRARSKRQSRRSTVWAPAISSCLPAT